MTFSTLISLTINGRGPSNTPQKVTIFLSLLDYLTLFLCSKSWIFQNSQILPPAATRPITPRPPAPRVAPQPMPPAAAPDTAMIWCFGPRWSSLLFWGLARSDQYWGDCRSSRGPYVIPELEWPNQYTLRMIENKKDRLFVIYVMKTLKLFLKR